MATYIPLYLRFKNGGAYTNAPDVTASFPLVSVGSLPVMHAELRGSNGFPYEEGAAINGGAVSVTCTVVRYTLAPFPIAAEMDVVKYLLNHRAAATQEARDDRFQPSTFIPGTILNVWSKPGKGSAIVSFDVKFADSDLTA